MARLIQTTVDEEELIKQYNFICELTALNKQVRIPEAIGLQNLLESLMMGLWGDVLIYDNGHDRYLVYMPGHKDLYYMSHDADVPNGICDLITDQGDGELTWTQLDNGDMVPVGYEEDVSIIAVPVGVRRQVLKIIEDDLESYEDHLVVT